METDPAKSSSAPDNHVTLIKGARVAVAWDESFSRHVYRRDVDVAFSPEGITQVGGSFTGNADTVIDGRDLMVMPGLVNIHSHLTTEPLNKGLWDEVGSPRLYNSSLYEFLFATDYDTDGMHAACRVALAELLKSGVTTLCDLSMPIEGWLDVLAASGMRVCLAPMFRSARWSTRNGYRVEYEWDEAVGRAGFERALATINEAENHPSGRLSGMVTPAQIDTCSEALLRDAYAVAEERSLPFQVHAGQSICEFHEMTRRHGMTPIEWMYHIGVLGRGTIVGHGIFLDHHPWTHWRETGDLRMLAEAGATVAHCPTVFARRGIALTHFGSYRKAGINLGIGTDVYPHNMLDELRLAAYVARLSAGNPHDTTTADILTAATVGGARALLRDDIGRLAAGCKADVVLVDCTHPAMRPCRDPMRSLIYSASERAVRHVFIDGRQVVRDGEVLTINYGAAAQALDEAQSRGIRGVSRNDWAGRSADELSPPSLSWV